ncbi:class III lanthionine synthetase LanKC [Streptomyces zingiberis]|uniref:non-specific serine/threonine protein kinase n=1 Tax=Streptomyces zingiberis TaxID=2053010 RepID=A0ABX1BT39_9ACTN|nr:class III lanthionine synthetase LanKC [Streptomyces zingiberis]NJP99622.1 protein kinase/lanthionine synthetase C family protein [Streptomyces zingiberis]
MDLGYAVFCDADRTFYDAPHRLAAGNGNAGSAPEGAAVIAASRYEHAGREAPEGWQRHSAGDWLAFRPKETRLPAQGWKIHVSACLDNAEKVLTKVWDHCVERGVAFKFIPSRYLLHTRNAKYADRGASGKFITVYPRDEREFETLATDLGELLDGEPGPYILSDLRWGAGPVYVRYGSFTERHCYDDQGVLRPAVENGEGRLVPDRRDPAFHLPDWVDPPPCLAPHLDARRATSTADLPYRIEKALHFSNGGGVYAGTDTRTGEKVVLKEARPHAGLAADGADAVTRLERERAALERLSGLVYTPEVRDSFVLGDHHFLVLEHLEGRPLNTFFARRHPLIEADPSPERLAEYTDWAVRMHAMVTEAVEAVHARGVVFNDLHLFNVMVSEDETSVALLDFEAAAHIDEGRRQVVANPGFVAPRGHRGFDVDRYALACLRIALFLPLTSLFAVDRAKAAHLAEIAAREFPVDRAWLGEAVAEILRDPAAGTARRPDGPAPAATATTPAGSGSRYLPAEPGDWPRSRDSLVRAILASATPEREDRFFPGDIAQFRTGGGLSYGYGSAGVLDALAQTGGGHHPEAEEWLLRRTERPAPGTPLGFYDGLAGVAWTLDRLGHRERALELARLITAEDWTGMAPDLHSGLAGIALALDALAATTGETDLGDAALRAARLIAERSARDGGTPAATGGGTGRTGGGVPRAGLLHGGAGRALLFLRLHERTRDTALLDLAAGALRADLARCVRGAGGALQVDEGRRTMPYLGAGSVGIGMVLDDYLAHRHDEEFDRSRREIVQAAQAKFYAQPGLFRGAAGMVLYLARTTAGGPGTDGAALRRQISSLTWGAMNLRGELAFPGEQMMRLSMDLATGTAGCLLALGTALHDRSVHLPFLPPLPRRPHEPVSAGGRTQENPVPTDNE